MTPLGDFLYHAGSARREPSVWDCGAFPAEWAKICGWPDPMAPWRGAYSTEDEALEIIREAGSLYRIFVDGMAKIGMPPAEAPYREGDIGVVQIRGVEAGAIYTGRRWAVVTERGLAFITLTVDGVAAAWRAVRSG